MNKTSVYWILVAAIITTLIPMTGLADGNRCRRRDGINERQSEQQDRIREGIRSGELTRREARRLEAQQFRIRFDEARARRSDGVLTLRERARIQRELDFAGRNIRREKNDRQDRFR